ncbi:hypothetical protein H696_03754 [Fonticula alba]|uniref:Uncharacterized protein n=1 Tax=Fonticula alba TaxID=691883 RepID=A0A058Z714_FONAL|nr:hypothetical protein H696_03754 [Fonticula alba]KCV69322.1 hypothetical protein H696_03754 [Fonticula alba]|eukprot:XP_009495887.1 hypothetical protein H696_03754 [Fonticula alba]
MADHPPGSSLARDRERLALGVSEWRALLLERRRRLLHYYAQLCRAGLEEVDTLPGAHASPDTLAWALPSSVGNGPMLMTSPGPAASFGTSSDVTQPVPPGHNDTQPDRPRDRLAHGRSIPAAERSPIPSAAMAPLDVGRPLQAGPLPNPPPESLTPALDTLPDSWSSEGASVSGTQTLVVAAAATTSPHSLDDVPLFAESVAGNPMHTLPPAGGPPAWQCTWPSDRATGFTPGRCSSCTDSTITPLLLAAAAVAVYGVTTGPGVRAEARVHAALGPRARRRWAFCPAGMAGILVPDSARAPASGPPATCPHLAAFIPLEGIGADTSPSIATLALGCVVHGSGPGRVLALVAHMCPGTRMVDVELLPLGPGPLEASALPPGAEVPARCTALGLPDGGLCVVFSQPGRAGSRAIFIPVSELLAGGRMRNSLLDIPPPADGPVAMPRLLPISPGPEEVLLDPGHGHLLLLSRDGTRQLPVGPGIGPLLGAWCQRAGPGGRRCLWLASGSTATGIGLWVLPVVGETPVICHIPLKIDPGVVPSGARLILPQPGSLVSNSHLLLGWYTDPSLPGERPAGGRFGVARVRVPPSGCLEARLPGPGGMPSVHGAQAHAQSVCALAFGDGGRPSGDHLSLLPLPGPAAGSTALLLLDTGNSAGLVFATIDGAPSPWRTTA